MKRRANHPCPQGWPELLGSPDATVAPYPAGREHDLDLWVGGEHLLEQLGMLEQDIAVRRRQIGSDFWVSQDVFMVKHAVVVKIEDQLSSTFHSDPASIFLISPVTSTMPVAWLMRSHWCQVYSPLPPNPLRSLSS